MEIYLQYRIIPYVLFVVLSVVFVYAAYNFIKLDSQKRKGVIIVSLIVSASISIFIYPIVSMELVIGKKIKHENWKEYVSIKQVDGNTVELYNNFKENIHLRNEKHSIELFNESVGFEGGTIKTNKSNEKLAKDREREKREKEQKQITKINPKSKATFDIRKRKINGEDVLLLKNTKTKVIYVMKEKDFNLIKE
mgnify:CR=1 FL=1